MPRRFFGFSIILVASLACSRDDTASAKTRNGARSYADAVPPRPAVVTPPSQPYRVVPVTTGGAISGIVELEGSAPVAAVIRPTVDQNVCGSSIVERNVRLSGPRVGGAIVWITDIRSGKAFPLERRFELANTNCTLDPYVQAISTQGTLNVSNDDKTMHTNRFINVGTGELVGIAPFNDDGEVVPLDVFREPAQIEVVSDRHPWTRAWIAVLDHPYYAQTAASGAFSIDGIPPGRYLVRAWHPGLGVADDSVTVPAGQQVSVAFRIRPKPSATGAPAPRPPSISEPEPVPSAPAASSTPTSSSTPTMIGPPPPG
ncbi:MAG TPA: carboxypeptidase regulatory-like domain-containing protein [Gemmatimonadaceae bacterium]|nr:carboxypeptidase regulatory-like domain-containing protein [Gemmatimonadaceae bacterium]